MLFVPTAQTDDVKPVSMDRMLLEINIQGNVSGETPVCQCKNINISKKSFIQAFVTIFFTHPLVGPNEEGR
jgi:hypothetical protein